MLISRHYFVPLAVLTAVFSASLPHARGQQTIPLNGIVRVAVRVKDVAAARAFYLALGYQEAPGATADAKQDQTSQSSRSMIQINEHQFLELLPIDPQSPRAGYARLCFGVDDLNAVHDDYASHGLKPGNISKAANGDATFSLAGPKQPLGENGAAVAQTIEYAQPPSGQHPAGEPARRFGDDRIADRLLGVSLAFIDVDEAHEFYLNDLNFRPLPNQQNLMHLPGNSGEFISIQPTTTQGSRSRIILEAQSLSRAEHDLKKNHVNYLKVGLSTGGHTAAILFNDPDGNDLLVQQR